MKTKPVKKKKDMKTKPVKEKEPNNQPRRRKEKKKKSSQKLRLSTVCGSLMCV